MLLQTCAHQLQQHSGKMEMYACAWTWRISQTVKREHHMLTNLDDIAPKLRKATAFSKLDASGGLPLDRESCHLSTFVTLIGRNWFQRAHFRISSTSEIFQRLLSEIIFFRHRLRWRYNWRRYCMMAIHRGI